MGSPTTKHNSANSRLRRRYRPEQVHLLFIGEAPPASGRFFYRGDSGLYRALREAFGPHENFLAEFKASGCYLIDLCGRPVDQLPPAARRAACRAAEPSLVRRLKVLQPASLACLVRSILPIVERAAARAGSQAPILDLPYPGRWRHHRAAFLKQISPVLHALTGCDIF